MGIIGSLFGVLFCIVFVIGLFLSIGATEMLFYFFPFLEKILENIDPSFGYQRFGFLLIVLSIVVALCSLGFSKNRRRSR